MQRLSASPANWTERRRPFLKATPYGSTKTMANGTVPTAPPVGARSTTLFISRTWAMDTTGAQLATRPMDQWKKELGVFVHRGPIAGLLATRAFCIATILILSLPETWHCSSLLNHICSLQILWSLFRHSDTGSRSFPATSQGECQPPIEQDFGALKPVGPSGGGDGATIDCGLASRRRRSSTLR